MELTDVLKIVATIVAVFGGSLSLAAFYQKRQENVAGEREDLARVLYLTSYILMSVSMGIYAVSGLILDLT